MATWIIYKATTPERLSYIGQTRVGLDKRRKEHERNNSGCRLIGEAIQYFGKENVEWEILHTCQTQKDANEIERREIAEQGTMYPGGYNIRHGGNGSLPPEELAKREAAQAAYAAAVREATHRWELAAKTTYKPVFGSFEQGLARYQSQGGIERREPVKVAITA